MFKKILLVAVSVALGTFVISQQSYGASTTNTTVQSTQHTVTTTPTAKKAKVVVPPTVETTDTTVTTTPATSRPVYDQASLKKMDVCTDGFDAKVGNDKKNVCLGKATAPDVAYSCIWRKKSESAFPSTPQGPCNLDNSEHRGTIVITKADYKSSPPLSYGTKAECCFRAAKGQPTSSVTSSTTSSPEKAK